MVEKIMLQTRSKRQQRRKAIILTSFLAFPIILNYFSPYLIIEGASLGIINGSLIVFALMFLSALFLGRLWCGWVCPAGGLQEMAVSINAAPVPGKRIDWIKWAIWVPWMALIVWAAVSAGGFQRVDFFFGTQNGISVAGDAERPIEMAYLVYYLVIALFFLLPLLVGRRAG